MVGTLQVATFEFLQGLGYGDIVVLAHSVGSFFCMDVRRCCDANALCLSRRPSPAAPLV